jgi:hypothetical protein
VILPPLVFPGQSGAFLSLPVSLITVIILDVIDKKVRLIVICRIVLIKTACSIFEQNVDCHLAKKKKVGCDAILIF